VANVFHRWASLGVYVPGDVNPYEDPETLLIDSLVHIEKSERVLGMMTSWISFYGHLLLTKKLKFPSKRERRLFSAVVETSRTRDEKLLRMVQKGRVRKTQHLYSDDLEVLKEVAEKDPNPTFLRHGFILKNFELVRDKIVLPPAGVYQRSAILRNRALYGVSLRSDFLALLPSVSEMSVRQIAMRLRVAPQTLELIVRDYVQSGLVEWTRKGRWSKLRWIGPGFQEAA